MDVTQPNASDGTAGSASAVPQKDSGVGFVEKFLFGTSAVVTGLALVGSFFLWLAVNAFGASVGSATTILATVVPWVLSGAVLLGCVLCLWALFRFVRCSPPE